MSKSVIAILSLLLASAAFAADNPPIAPQTGPASARLPVEAFAQLDFVDDAKLSPDGTHIAGIFGIDGKKTLAILKISNIKENPIRLPFPDRAEISNVRWINDNYIIATLYRIDKDGTHDVYVGRLVSIDCQTGAFKILLPEMHSLSPAELIWASPDGKPEILVEARKSDTTGVSYDGSVALENEGFWPSVYSVNLATGRTLKVLDGDLGVTNWFADQSGTVRLGYGHDDNKLEDTLLYRGIGSNAFKRTQRASIKRRDTLIAPFLFTPNTDHALAVAKDDKDNAIIGEYDLTNLALIRTVYTADAFDLEPILSADETTLIGAATNHGRGNFWFDPTLAKVQKALEDSLATGFVEITGMSSDRTKMLIKHYGGDAPGALYFMDTGEGAMHRFAYINARIGSQHLGETKMITYAARDGLKIEAKLTLPRDQVAKNLPMIMLPHGGPWAHDTLSYDYLSQFLANRGYLVLQPNFRGSDGYGDAFERKGEGQLGLAMQDDLTDGVNWAVKQGMADPHRICILGGSYGGYAAMWGIIKDPDLYKCAISIAGVSNLSRGVNAFEKYLYGKTYKFQWDRMSPDFAAVSPINFVSKVKVPMLLIHGKQDVTVDISQSQSMFAAMKSAGKTVEYVELPSADHHYQRQEDRLSLLSSIETFLKKYNPAD
jgi:dipeptidyl aminopeptidase/acylaminoacyl peptidase